MATIGFETAARRDALMDRLFEATVAAASVPA